MINNINKMRLFKKDKVLLIKIKHRFFAGKKEKKALIYRNLLLGISSVRKCGKK